MSETGARTIVVWCPDWPVIAAEIVEGVPASGPVVVLHGNRVVACSEAARLEGVRKGLRRREAQSRCPRLTVVEHDLARDARAFEPVVAAVEEVAAGVEVIRPGACALAVRGPARYFGGEQVAAERIVEQIAESCEVESQVGIADGVFGAGLAAREGRVVAPGETPAFLAGVTIEALERPGLADLLKRLGITTLGGFAALPAADVLTRFGFDGALAHRLARGADHRPLAVRKPPPDLDVAETYDEPLERVDVAAFAGRALAERLHDRLAAHGLACTRLGIEAVTADGQELHRVWRHDGTLTSAAIAERVRWQLDGWLTGARRGVTARPTAGLVRLRLIPDGVLAHLGLQPGLWGGSGAERERAHRAFSRVQGLLGPEAVVTPVVGGGRSADDQVHLVPWGDERTPARPATSHDDPIPGIVITPVLSLTAAPAPGTDPAVRVEPADWAAVIPLPARRDRGEATGPAEASITDLPRSQEGKGELPGWMPGVVVGASVLDLAAVKRRRAGHLKADQGEGDEGAELRAGRFRAKVAEAGATRRAPGLRLAGARSQPAVARMLGSPLAEARAVDTPRKPASADVVVAVRRGSAPRGGRRGHPGPVLPSWPGRLPKPSPATVLPRPLGAVVLDAAGTPVGVSARLELTGDPAALIVDRGQPVGVDGWAGPWPVDERWWAPGEQRRRARFQVRLVDGRALLVALAGGHWLVEAVYD